MGQLFWHPKWDAAGTHHFLCSSRIALFAVFLCLTNHYWCTVEKCTIFDYWYMGECTFSKVKSDIPLNSINKQNKCEEKCLCTFCFNRKKYSNDLHIVNEVKMTLFLWCWTTSNPVFHRAARFNNNIEIPMQQLYTIHRHYYILIALIWSGWWKRTC